MLQYLGYSLGETETIHYCKKDGIIVSEKQLHKDDGEESTSKL